MVTIREFRSTDVGEVAAMYKLMCIEVYPHRTFNKMQHFVDNVEYWHRNNYDIMVSEDKGEVTGFSMCYVDDMGGIVDDYYIAECLYIKPGYRKGRSAYLLIKQGERVAEANSYMLSTYASENTEMSRLYDKRERYKVFTKYERDTK